LIKTPTSFVALLKPLEESPSDGQVSVHEKNNVEREREREREGKIRERIPFVMSI